MFLFFFMSLFYISLVLLTEFRYKVNWAYCVFVCVHSCCLTRHSTVEQRRITQKRVTMDEGRDREKWLSSSNTQKPWAEICWFMIKKRLKEPNKEKNELVKVMPVSSWYKLKRRCGIYFFFWCRDLPASISKVMPRSIHNQNPNSWWRQQPFTD